MLIDNRMNLPPKTAVLLAAYNGMAWIEEQIDSINSQTKVDVDLFISVDLSTDGTYEWCQKLANERANVNLLPYGDHFGGAAKNFLRLIRDVDFSAYDYISLADQDDIWLPNKLIHAANMLKNNNIDAYSSDVIAFWSDGQEKLVKKSYPQKKYDYFFEAAGPGCSYVLKYQPLQQFKDFLMKNWDEVNSIESHDWLIYAFFRSREMPWYIDSKALMLYRQHESNQVGSNFGLLAYLKRIKMIKSGWYRSEVKDILKATSISDDCAFNLEKWFLIKNFYQLRRQNRDAFILLLTVLFGIF
jgi:rhamnosyltransferase